MEGQVVRICFRVVDRDEENAGGRALVDHVRPALGRRVDNVGIVNPVPIAPIIIPVVIAGDFKGPISRDVGEGTSPKGSARAIEADLGIEDVRGCKIPISV